MVHADHVFLLHQAISQTTGTWADLGSGDGAFTLALRDLGGPKISIYSVDKDKNRLETQNKAMQEMFPNSSVTFQAQDFTKELRLPPLDGILMANSLHYVKNRGTFLKHLKTMLKPTGKLVLVEYNTDTGNVWVPYPLSYTTFKHEAEAAGFTNISVLDTVPSEFLGEIYAAEAVNTM